MALYAVIRDEWDVGPNLVNFSIELVWKNTVIVCVVLLISWISIGCPKFMVAYPLILTLAGALYS